MTNIYINDTLVDLYQNTQIAISIVNLNIGDLSARYVSYTNQFTIPASPSNNRLFGAAHIEQSNTNIPYGLQSCKVVSNGIEVMPQAVCYVQSYRNGYMIFVMEAFIGLFDSIEGKTLSDLPLGSASWSASGIDSLRLSSSEFVTAVMNWGRSATYEANYFLPCYYYSTLITKILTLAGYTATGAILSSTDYTDLVCTPVNRFVYKDSDVALNTSASDTTSSTALTITVDQGYLSVPYNLVNYGSLTAPKAYVGNVDVSVYFNFLTFTINIFSVSSVNVRLYGSIQGLLATGTPDITINLAGSASTYSFTGINLLAGETVDVRVYFNKDATYPTDQVYVDIGNAATSISITATNAVPRSAPDWSKLVNESISLKDVMKDFFTRFAIIPKRQGTNIVLKTLQEITTDYAGAVDWTSKRVNIIDDQIDFQTGYSQNNYYRYTDAINDMNLGAGNMDISNNILSASSEIFTSVFSNANRWSSLLGTPGGPVATIPVYDATSAGISDFKNEPPLTLLTLKNRITEGAITFNVTPRTDYKLAYFIDLVLAKDTSFSYFVNKYYSRLKISLQKNKTLTHTYNLTDGDIATFDPHKMVRDGDNYYTVIKIPNFISGVPTKVGLLKIQ